MRLFGKWFVGAAVGVMLAACSGGAATPEGVAKDFVAKSYAGEGDAVVAMIHIPAEDRKPGVEEWVGGKVKAGVAKQKEYADKNGGVAEIVAETAEIREGQPRRADVKLQIRFGSGQTRSDRVGLVETENGWKIRL